MSFSVSFRFSAARDHLLHLRQRQSVPLDLRRVVRRQQPCRLPQRSDLCCVTGSRSTATREASMAISAG